MLRAASMDVVVAFESFGLEVRPQRVDDLRHVAFHNEVELVQAKAVTKLFA